LSARLALAFMRQGCRVSVLCPAGHPLMHVSGISRAQHYRGIDSLGTLRRALQESGADIVVPCDDGVVAQLHALHADVPALRELIERSLGSAASYAVVDSRYELLAVAEALGIRVAKTARVGSRQDLANWHREVASSGVLKVDGTCGGAGVRISHSLDDSILAWNELRAPMRAATAFKRRLIDRDPLAPWGWRHPAGREVTIQELVDGPPANAMMACLGGTMLAVVSVSVIASEGATGAATIVRRVSNEAMASAARLLAERLQLTGFYGLDFMLEAGTGRPFLIEMNPRCTQLGHLEWPDQGDLASAFCAAWRGQPAPAAQHPIQALDVAFFPQALALTSGPSRFADAYRDVPADQAQLVRELLRAPWPQRQWAARLYHAIRPLDASAPVIHEAMNLNDTAEGAR
jgi:hypothetical protein